MPEEKPQQRVGTAGSVALIPPASTGVGGATGVAATAAGARAVPIIPAAATRSAASATILAALIAYLTRRRERNTAWLVEQLPRRPRVQPRDIEEVLAQEVEREHEFQRRAAERMTRDLPIALAIPAEAQPDGSPPRATARERAVRSLFAREERYQRQRSEAMAARAIAAVDRQVLRRESPLGAFWQLDPTVVEHTAGCLVMGGKFWPWAVLDRVHPPRHHGCPCRLRGYGDAIAAGLITPGAVRDVSAAIRAAAGIVMEADVAERLAAGWDAELRLLDEAGRRGLLAEGWVL